MRADNAADYTTWDREQLGPALAQIPLSKLGAGLGCWIDSRTKGTWNVKPQSAIDRVCLLMNKSVRSLLSDTTGIIAQLPLRSVALFSSYARPHSQSVAFQVSEIDMFILKPSATPPFPEPFWIPVLERYMAGGGCVAKIPAPLPTCPNASVGSRKSSWVPGGDAGCCTATSKRIDANGHPAHCNVTCAMAECANAKGMVWRPENYSVHPYECCHQTSSFQNLE